MNCINCGRELLPGESYCSNCGYTSTTIVPSNRKSKLTAILLCFFLGGIGIHDFYLGYTKNGIIKILLTCCTGFGGSLWALIDFIRLLTGDLRTDARGVKLK
jgi:TM2 domain-containing membrane protein YozV